MSRYRCPECAYVYDETHGDRHEGLKAGTPWSHLPENFACPGCAVRERDDFERLDTTSDDAAA